MGGPGLVVREVRREGTTSCTVWLIRHGATEWSQEGRLNGWTDIPLNELGRTQVRELARSIELPPRTTIWTSDLERAAASAALLVTHGSPLKGVTVRSDQRLRELNFGELEGLTWSELDTDTRTALTNFDGFEAPEGESVAALVARVDGFLAELGRHEPTAGPHVVVTHGGVIRTLLRRGPGDRSVQPAQLVRLSLVEGRVQAG